MQQAGEQRASEQVNERQEVAGHFHDFASCAHPMSGISIIILSVLFSFNKVMIHVYQEEYNDKLNGWQHASSTACSSSM